MLVDIERERIINKAKGYLEQAPRTVTADSCPRSEGSKHDFFSEGDYWWPNPEDPDGKYIRRDGETNPENFVAHRKSLVRLSDIIGTFASAYSISQDKKYAQAAEKHLQAWFVDPETKMNPSLLFGQAIKGRHAGRSIGVIDTIHLVEVARGTKFLLDAGAISAADGQKIKQWFRDYLTWINSHEYGLKEKQHPNNHGVCWSMQAAAFAELVGDEEVLVWIRNQFKTVYISSMMNLFGGFPKELERTKPYGYSLFVIDAMAAVAEIASTEEDNLWEFELPDGRGMKLGMEFIIPYVKDKSSWPYATDVQYWDEWPVRHPSLLFAGMRFGNSDYLKTWASLESDPGTFEVLRNLPIRHPLIWEPKQYKKATLTEPTSQSHRRLTEDWEFVRGDLGGIWEAFRPYKPGKPEKVPLWSTVTLPHCFNAFDAVDPDVNYYQGPGWYKTAVSVDQPANGSRVLLHFEGAGQKTEVYVYTKKVGSHVGGYDEFTIDITDAVTEFLKQEDAQRFQGKIPIAIRCDNSRDVEMIPSDLSDFNVYGGLYRYVNLIEVPAVSFDHVQINTNVDAQGVAGEIDFKAMLRGDVPNESPAKVLIQITDPLGKLVVEKSFDANAGGTMLELGQIAIEKPQLWSPDAPNLYRCDITVSSNDVEHSIEELIGFRHLEWINRGPFKINGQRLLLRGTHRHEDHAGLGAAMTEDLLRHEIRMMKEMGINFIRLGHYQQSRIVLDLCDRWGLLVWEEIPWCRGGLGGETYQQQARDMLTNMIAQHRNHPSVFIWGLGNENDWPNDFREFDKDSIRAFMTELNELSHQLDPSRKTAIRRCEFCKDVVDIYSPSIWAGWYRGKFTDYAEVSEKEMKDVDHFLHVEWGASNHARRHSEDPDRGIEAVAGGQGADERDGDASMVGGKARVSKDGDWTETYACNLIDWHLKEQENMPWLTGTAYWPFKDFSTPVRPENPVPYVNQKGVVERDFEKKEGFYVFQSYWTDKPMARIYGHTWPVRWGDEGQNRLVKVYSNCPEAELFLNGKSLGVKKRDSQNYPAAGLRWNVAFQTGTNDLKVVAKKGKIEVTDQIEVQYQTEKWQAPARLELSLVGQSSGCSQLEVVAYDENGVRCLDAKNMVRFQLAGDGRLIDNLGTSRGSRQVQLYNGRALIDVEQTGECVVSVKSAGLKTAFVTLSPGDASVPNQ